VPSQTVFNLPTRISSGHLQGTGHDLTYETLQLNVVRSLNRHQITVPQQWGNSVHSLCEIFELQRLNIVVQQVAHPARQRSHCDQELNARALDRGSKEFMQRLLLWPQLQHVTQ